ncbi:MAG TPA: hypothetical protein VIF62_21185, partial [Labilithrix sp.]
DASTDGGDGGLFSTYACCNNRCVDTAASDANCGMCGNACGVGAACCASSCTDITSNAASCGGCGKVCSNNNIATPACTLGKCSGACNPGFDDCDNDKLGNGCESDIYNDPNKCGACNKSCSSNHVLAVSCSVGTCDGACDSANGWADCNNNKLVDGCEANITNNADHCGACPNVCSNNNMATRTCATSTCNGGCNGGYADCNANKLADGCEVNTATDANNCGGCNNVCSNNNMSTRTCAGNTCNGTCNGGFADCDNNKLSNGCETNTQIDPDHCGACLNKACSGNHVTSRTCGAGVCNGTCDVAGGWADCNNDKLTDGCETKSGLDSLHCTNGAGAPGCMPCNTNPNRSCVNGVCSAGYGMTFGAVTFIDACATPDATVLPNTDDATATITLPAAFAFKVFNAAPAQAWVSSNGVFGFSATQDSGCCGFTALPYPSQPSMYPAVFAYSRDLVTRTGVCLKTVGAAPNRKFVATWGDACLYNGAPCDTVSPTHLTFSVILEETTNRIDVVYQTFMPATINGSDALLGIESDPATNLFTQFNSPGGANTLAAPGTIQYVPYF